MSPPNPHSLNPKARLSLPVSVSFHSSFLPPLSHTLALSPYLPRPPESLYLCLPLTLTRLPASRPPNHPIHHRTLPILASSRTPAQYPIPRKQYTLPLGLGVRQSDNLWRGSDQSLGFQYSTQEGTRNPKPEALKPTRGMILFQCVSCLGLGPPTELEMVHKG